jgi:tetratricopeptide (TPR) repeat protein
MSLYEAAGETHAGARVSGRLAQVEAGSGRLSAAVERMERALAVISTDEPDPDVAFVAARLSLHLWFTGDVEQAAERAELALGFAEALGLPDILAHALINKALIASTRGHIEESLAFLNHALKISLEHERYEPAAIAYFNLSDTSFRRDRYRDALAYLEAALALARKSGERLREWELLSETTYPLFMTGRWAESLAAYAEIPEGQVGSIGVLLSPLTSILEIYLHRGDLQRARHVFSLYRRLETTADVQEQVCYAGGLAAIRLAEGDYAGSLESGQKAVEVARVLGAGQQSVKQGFVCGIEAAIELGDSTAARELLATLASLPKGHRPPYLEAQAARFEARLAGSDASAERGFLLAAPLFRELEVPFWLAVTLLEHAEWRARTGRASDAEPLLAEAREIFERLEATPWLERVAAAAGRAEATAV